ncbi:MAG: SDR family oxidoreductase [Candidatus Heimdallarchaeota archaeon]|nr:SDR family oxidoreductase [Candidatus Heimdallarchaeota archaeon]MBY8993453.1 SDR family oxidoreductase [Candidatus Heimdallarchaeota archaeon]
MVKKAKTVLVTGAASGIGLAITEYLAQKGDKVIATDFNKEALAELDGRPNITTFYLDVSDSQSISDVKDKISENDHGLDGLINNAGIFVGGPLVEMNEKDVEKIMDVNVLGPFRVSKILFPLVLKNKGRIINMGSEAGRISFPVNGPYSMSKYALEAFSDSLRRELMFLGIKVIHLQIGAVNTGFLERTYSCYAEEIDIEKTLFPKLIAEVIPTCEKEFDRCAEPKDIAKVVYRVLHKKRPKARYKIKNNRGRRLLEFLPASLIDFAMLKMFK